MSNERISYLEELKQKAINGYEHYKNAFMELEDAYLLNYKSDLYESLKKRNKSKNFIPKLNAKAKRIYDGLSETYFNNDKFAKLEPYINSSEDVISKWQEALDHYTQMLNLYKVFAPIFLKAPFVASCVAKVYWDKDRVAIDDISLQDIYFDPDAKGIKDINYIVHRIFLSKEDIKNYIKKGVFKSETFEMENENPYERLELYEVYELREDKWSVSTLFDGEVLRDSVALKDGQPFIVGYMLPQIKKTDEDIFVCAYGEPALASMLPLQNDLM